MQEPAKVEALYAEMMFARRTTRVENPRPWKVVLDAGASQG